MSRKRRLRDLISSGLRSLTWLGALRRGIDRRIVVALSCSTAVFVILIAFRDFAYTVDARTEIAQIDFVGEALADWELPDAWLIDNPSNEGMPIGPGTLLIEDGARVVVSRSGFGPVRIELTRRTRSGAHASPGLLRGADGDERTLPSGAVVIVASGRTGIAAEDAIVLPLQGVVTIGDDVAAGVDAVLLSGAIRIAERQLAANRRYIALEQSLDSGDRVALICDRQSISCRGGRSVISGFLRIAFQEEQAGFDAVVHGHADSARVDRLGGGTYEVRPSVLDRVIKDPFLSGLGTLLAFALAMVEMATSLVPGSSSGGFEARRRTQEQAGARGVDGDD